MMSAQEVEAIQAREGGQEVVGGIHSTTMGREERREGFEDLTDLQNDEFIVGSLPFFVSWHILISAQYVY